jgi:uncharacterized protein with beta-barrel porin domain
MRCPREDGLAVRIAGNAANTRTAWAEGFGTGFDKTGTLSNAGYDGHFAGTSFGYERKRRDLTYGIFGSYANHRVSGDGLAKGDWATVGVYGRVDRRHRFIEGSISYGYGDYDLTRHVLIPGATFSNVGDLPDIVLDPMSKRAVASTHAHDVSMRLGSGQNWRRHNGWTVGPRSEFSLSHMAFGGYRESGADSLNLSVNGYDTTYLEGGLGLFAGKRFRNVTATGKVMGMYGGTVGDDLSGNFLTFGSPYRVSGGHMNTAWVAPEATLSWQISRNVSISGGYAGRLGERYSEHTGSAAVNVRW